MADKEVRCCKECGSIQIVESAYSKMTEKQKVEFIAHQTAIEFLKDIHERYDRDGEFRFEALDPNLKFLDKPEVISVLSDTNVSQLQKLLVDFYFREVKLEITAN